MSVIAHIRIPAHAFELGRILQLDGAAAIQLENMVPLGEEAIPFFTVESADHERFQELVRNHPSVTELRIVTEHEDKVLYALDWLASRDVFFQGLVDHGVQLLSARGGTEGWEFELRFPNAEMYSGFQEYCANAHIDLEVGRVYNPTRPEAAAWYGLTREQRETLVQAVRGGYYSIPRTMSAKELAEEFDISDQAATERLRRAIVTLVTNTLIAAEEIEYESVE